MFKFIYKLQPYYFALPLSYSCAKETGIEPVTSNMWNNKKNK